MDVHVKAAKGFLQHDDHVLPLDAGGCEALGPSEECAGIDTGLLAGEGESEAQVDGLGQACGLVSKGDYGVVYARREKFEEGFASALHMCRVNHVVFDSYSVRLGFIQFNPQNSKIRTSLE